MRNGARIRRRPRRASFWPAVLAATALLVAGGLPGTLAQWNTATTMTGGTLEAGSLDIVLNGDLSGAGGTLVDTTVSLAGMAPGESVTRTISVGNEGDAPLSWTLRAAASGSLSDRVEVLVWLDSESALNLGSAGSANRSGTCTTGGGATQVFGWSALGSPSQVIGPPGRSLTVGQARTLCVGVRLAAGTPSTRQGETATLQLVVDAEQVPA